VKEKTLEGSSHCQLELQLSGVLGGKIIKMYTLIDILSLQ
jgi:hypothetical protein